MRTSRTFNAIVIAGFAGMTGAGDRAAAQDRPLEADFAEVYRAGGIAAPDWAQFTSPNNLGFDGSGNLYVLDSGAFQVVVINRNGELERTVGSQGQGPGEFNAPMTLAVWTDGALAVGDMGHNAYQLFGPDGQLDRFVKMSAGEGLMAGFAGMRSSVKPDPRGGALIAQGAPGALAGLSGLTKDLTGMETEPGVDDRGLERLDLGGDILEAELVLQGWRIPSEEAGADITVNDLQDVSGMVGMMIGNETHFEPAMIWDVLPDGTIAYSDSSAYAIKLADGRGEAKGVLRRELYPEPVTRRIRSGMIEEKLREMDEQMEEGGAAAMLAMVPPGMVEAMRDGLEKMDFFPEVPVVRGLRATWDGSLWIQRRGDEPWDDSGPIDVFNGDGEYVGTFAADETAMPNAFGPDGLVAFVELDEMDVPTIVVRRLPAAVR